MTKRVEELDVHEEPLRAEHRVFVLRSENDKSPDIYQFYSVKKLAEFLLENWQLPHRCTVCAKLIMK